MVIRLPLLLVLTVHAHSAFMSCSVGPASLCNGGRRTTALDLLRHRFPLVPQDTQVNIPQMFLCASEHVLIAREKEHVDMSLTLPVGAACRQERRTRLADVRHAQPGPWIRRLGSVSGVGW